MPYGFRYTWDPYGIWLHVISDGLIAISCFCIALLLVCFVRRRKDLALNWLFLCFAVLIVACGATQLMEIWYIWRPAYWLAGGIKLLAAVASVTAAVVLVRSIPHIVALPSNELLTKANRALEHRSAELMRSNSELERIGAERERIKKALEESEERFRFALRGSPVTVFNHDRQLRYTWIHNATMNGHRNSEYVGRTDAEILGEEEGAGLMAIKRRAIETGVGIRTETTVNAPSGQRFLDLTVEPLRNAAGETVGVTCISTDVTALRRSEQQVRALNANLEQRVEERTVQLETANRELSEQTAILEMAPVLVRDMDHRIVYWTLGAQQLYGFSKEEALGHLSHELFHTDFPEPQAQIEATLLSTGRWEGELARRKHNGEKIVMASQWVLHRDPAGKPIRILEVNTNITERMAAQKALEQSNLDLQQFAYIASHDLKTPLRTISGFVDLLQINYGGQLDARGVDWIRRTSEGARRLEARINNLLSYSRLDSRGAPFESVDCGILLEEALEGLEALINETEADINAGKLPTIMGDPTQLVQLFQNLISNGIKYRSASPPQVHVSAEEGNGEWVFSVADNGIGIDPQHHKRIFELFQRLHKQEDYPGDGIGLTLCRRIVGRHGGKIWLESQFGKGCTIFFTLLNKT
jgi:PAS domain S-box-containing protein